MAADFPDINWNPIIMIDKDSTIRKAVVNTDQSMIMALLKRVQHAPTEKEEEEALELLESSFNDFYTYFKANWLFANWKDAWMIRSRPGFREGLYNTNNMMEALWKKVVQLDIFQKKAKAPETMLITLEETQHCMIWRFSREWRPKRNLDRPGVNCAL